MTEGWKRERERDGGCFLRGPVSNTGVGSRLGRVLFDVRGR